ncbi:MAG: hypothetical protein PWR01_3876, partial [Clostridiales bacterium]|nr:hypothetical protein [Clostridiales bacterium]MDN5282803.1 hypothetical protein [Candidatus Ozemobacter sp.]
AELHDRFADCRGVNYRQKLFKVAFEQPEKERGIGCENLHKKEVFFKVAGFV